MLGRRASLWIVVVAVLALGVVVVAAIAEEEAVTSGSSTVPVTSGSSTGPVTSGSSTGPVPSSTQPTRTTTDMEEPEPLLADSEVGARLHGEASVEIFVDVAHPGSSPSGPGTPDAPYSSIQAALDRAQVERGEMRGVEITVRAGIYREQLSIGSNSEAAPPLVLDGGGLASIRGSEEWNDWQPVGRGVWAHQWPYSWGSEPDVESVVGRREMVFVDGVRMSQVTAPSALAAASFYVDESGSRLLLTPPEGVDPTVALVEVAIRPRLLLVDQASNVVIRGFEFTHAAAPFEVTAVGITNASDIAFVDNLVRDNSWTGLGLATSRRVSLERNQVNDNGGGGISVYQAPFLLMSDNETSMNNWRGERGGYTGWSIGAVKMVSQHDTLVRRHRSVENATRGFWLDYDISNVRIEDAVLCRNLTDGIMVEAVQGPVQLVSIQSCDNEGNGILIVNGMDVVMWDSVVCGNGGSAIRLDAEPGGRTLEIAPDPVDLPAFENISLVGNRIGGSELVLANLGSRDWSASVGSLLSEYNAWHSTDPASAFVFPGVVGAFEKWRLVTGQDMHSTFVTDLGC